MSDRPVAAKIMPYRMYTSCSWCGTSLTRALRYCQYVGLCPACHALIQEQPPDPPRRTDGEEIQWREVRRDVYEGEGPRHRFRVYATGYGAGLHLCTGYETPIGNFRNADAAKAVAQATEDLWNREDIRT